MVEPLCTQNASGFVIVQFAPAIGAPVTAIVAAVVIVAAEVIA